MILKDILGIGMLNLSKDLKSIRTYSQIGSDKC